MEVLILTVAPLATRMAPPRSSEWFELNVDCSIFTVELVFTYNAPASPPPLFLVLPLNVTRVSVAVSVLTNNAPPTYDEVLFVLNVVSVIVIVPPAA